MTRRTLHRAERELTGKTLSANTLASLLVAQGVRSVADLDPGRPMAAEVLLFLNRERALRYWQAQGWLHSDRDGFYLIPAGLDDVEAREAGEARGATGKKKPGNVSPALVRQALNFILGGGSEGDTPVLSRDFDLPETRR